MGIQIPGGEDAWAAFRALYDQCNDQGFNRFEKELRSFVERYGWESIFPPYDKALFRCRARWYVRAVQSVEYSRRRQAQLKSSGFSFLVYRVGNEFSCVEHHKHLDGLVLPVDHPFWDVFMPPTLPNCSCCVAGARSLSSSLRVGGDLEKLLPADWGDCQSHTGLPRGIERLFCSRKGPETLEILEWIEAGNADLL
jgi:hypothetical protein